MHCMQSNYKITWHNKLRQFCFKRLHRIVVTSKELKRFGITDYRKCLICSENDSIEHAFFECQSFKKSCDESLQWFNNAKESCYIRIYIKVNYSAKNILLAWRWLRFPYSKLKFFLGGSNNIWNLFCSVKRSSVVIPSSVHTISKHLFLVSFYFSTLFLFNKNIFYKNIEAEICENLRTFQE